MKLRAVLCISALSIAAALHAQVIACGSNNYWFCYQDNQDTITSYICPDQPQCTLQILFCEGGTEEFHDWVIVYDGLDNTAPVIFNGSGSTIFTGTLLYSTTNAITLEIRSDEAVNCQDGDYVPLHWAVGCAPVCSAMSVSGVEKPRVHISPTPASETLSVELGSNEPSDISLVDLFGHIILTHRASSEHVMLPIGHLAAGRYHLVVTSSTTRQVLPVIKE